MNKNEYMPPPDFKALLISEYRSGLSVKSLKKRYGKTSIDTRGEPLPADYIETVILEEVVRNGFTIPAF